VFFFAACLVLPFFFYRLGKRTFLLFLVRGSPWEGGLVLFSYQLSPWLWFAFLHFLPEGEVYDSRPSPAPAVFTLFLAAAVSLSQLLRFFSVLLFPNSPNITRV